jgi:hypothetical protein
MKNKKQIELCRFSIAGVQYNDYQCCKNLRAGAKLALIWERNNKYDSNAIRISCDGIKLGYVPKGEFQDMLHEYRMSGIKVHATLAAYNKNNPTWHMLTVKCDVARILDDANEAPF